MFPKYLLIAYKPNSDDYCRGCHMSSYDSHFVNVESEDIDDIITTLARLKSEEFRCNEKGYDEILIYGPEEDIGYIHMRADELANKLIQENKEYQIKKKQKEEDESREEILEFQRKQYLKLKEQFE